MGENRYRPTAEQLRAELERISEPRSGSIVGRVLLVLLVLVLVIAALAAVLLPGFVIYGDSMLPALAEGDVVLAFPYTSPNNGDMIAFRFEDRVLIKRVIGSAGDRIELLDDGQVLRNGSPLPETYSLRADALAPETENPCIVPDGTYYVLGDNRISSVDSRNEIIGFVPQEQVIGRVFLVLWPFSHFHLYT